MSHIFGHNCTQEHFNVIPNNRVDFEGYLVVIFKSKVMAKTTQNKHINNKLNIYDIYKFIYGVIRE